MLVPKFLMKRESYVEFCLFTVLKLLVTRSCRKFLNSYFVGKENIFFDSLKVTEGIFGNEFVNMLISIINLK